MRTWVLTRLCAATASISSCCPVVPAADVSGAGVMPAGLDLVIGDAVARRSLSRRTCSDQRAVSCATCRVTRGVRNWPDDAPDFPPQSAIELTSGQGPPCAAPQLPLPHGADESWPPGRLQSAKEPALMQRPKWQQKEVSNCAQTLRATKVAKALAHLGGRGSVSNSKLLRV